MKRKRGALTPRNDDPRFAVPASDMAAAKAGDKYAADRILKRLEGLIRWQAARARGDMEFGAFEQELRIAVLSAIRKFNPKKRVPFHAYALLWMKALGSRAKLAAVAGAGPVSNPHGFVFVGLDAKRDGGLSLAGTIADPANDAGETLDAANEAARLDVLVSKLDERQRVVVEGRRRGRSLDAIARDLDCSRETVRQVEGAALARMRALATAYRWRDDAA